MEFQSCDGGAPLWLDGPLAIDLQELHAELAPGVEPFEGIFIDVVANDSDPNGDPLLVGSFDQGTNGTVADNGNGTVTYTPDSDFNQP